MTTQAHLQHASERADTQLFVANLFLRQPERLLELKRNRPARGNDSEQAETRSVGGNKLARQVGDQDQTRVLASRLASSHPLILDSRPCRVCVRVQVVLMELPQLRSCGPSEQPLPLIRTALVSNSNGPDVLLHDSTRLDDTYCTTSDNPTTSHLSSLVTGKAFPSDSTSNTQLAVHQQHAPNKRQARSLDPAF